MTDIVILVLVLLIAVLALLRAKKHFKGGCCGSGSNTIRSRKTLTDPKIGERCSPWKVCTAGIARPG